MADVRHRGRGRRTAYRRLAVAGAVERPAGLETLASAIGEEAITLEDVCEPFLMQLGFLARTPRGRVATKLAYAHLGFLKDDENEGQLTL